MLPEKNVDCLVLGTKICRNVSPTIPWLMRCIFFLFPWVHGSPIMGYPSYLGWLCRKIQVDIQEENRREIEFVHLFLSSSQRLKINNKNQTHIDTMDPLEAHLGSISFYTHVLLFPSIERISFPFIHPRRRRRRDPSLGPESDRMSSYLASFKS